MFEPPKLFEYIDIVVRYVPRYGFMPIVKVENEERFRGSFYPTSAAAFEIAEVAVAVVEKALNDLSLI